MARKRGFDGTRRHAVPMHLSHRHADTAGGTAKHVEGLSHPKELPHVSLPKSCARGDADVQTVDAVDHCCPQPDLNSRAVILINFSSRIACRQAQCKANCTCVCKTCARQSAD